MARTCERLKPNTFSFVELTSLVSPLHLRCPLPGLGFKDLKECNCRLSGQAWDGASRHSQGKGGGPQVVNCQEAAGLFTRLSGLLTGPPALLTGAAGLFTGPPGLMFTGLVLLQLLVSCCWCHRWCPSSSSCCPSWCCATSRW